MRFSTPGSRLAAALKVAWRARAWHMAPHSHSLAVTRDPRRRVGSTKAGAHMANHGHLTTEPVGDSEAFPNSQCHHRARSPAMARRSGCKSRQSRAMWGRGRSRSYPPWRFLVNRGWLHMWACGLLELGGCSDQADVRFSDSSTALGRPGATKADCALFFLSCYFTWALGGPRARPLLACCLVLVLEKIFSDSQLRL